MFWKCFKKYPVIISCQDQISYPELQEMVAIILMEEDHEKASKGYEIIEQKKQMEKMKSIRR